MVRIRIADNSPLCKVTTNDFFKLQDIEPGAELTFNYQLESVGDEKKPCLCGAANCSGLHNED